MVSVHLAGMGDIDMNFIQFVMYIAGLFFGFFTFIYLLNTGKMDDISDWLDDLWTDKND